MNTCIQFFCAKYMLSLLLSTHLWVELLRYMVIPCLTVWRTARLLSKVIALFYLPINNVWGFHFLCILFNTYVCLYDSGHLNVLMSVKWYAIMALILHFSNCQWCRAFSMCLSTIEYCLWRNIYSYPFLIFKLQIVSFSFSLSCLFSFEF